jgi:uncharacterized protein (TIGR02271 family)
MSYASDDRRTDSERQVFVSRQGRSPLPDDLERLDRLDNWEIADGEMDPREMTLTGKDGVVGKIKNLIASPSTGHVHFVLVDVQPPHGTPGHQVLLPISMITLDRDNAMTKLSGEQIRNAPPWHEEIGREGMSAHYAYWTYLPSSPSSERPPEPVGAAPQTGNRDEVVIPVVEERLTVDKEQVEHGGIRIRSRVIEKPVEAEVTLRKEHVTVERRPADRPVSENDPVFQEGTMEIREIDEVPVVSKEARVVEEVVVGREAEEHMETVRGTVRRTEVESDDDARIPLEHPASPPSRRV